MAWRTRRKQPREGDVVRAKRQWVYTQGVYVLSNANPVGAVVVVQDDENLTGQFPISKLKVMRMLLWWTLEFEGVDFSPGSFLDWGAVYLDQDVDVNIAGLGGTPMSAADGSTTDRQWLWVYHWAMPEGPQNDFEPGQLGQQRHVNFIDWKWKRWHQAMSADQRVLLIASCTRAVGSPLANPGIDAGTLNLFWRSKVLLEFA